MQLQQNLNKVKNTRTKKAFKNILRSYAINNHFQYRTTKSCKLEFIRERLNKDCNWHIRASGIDTNMFIVRKFNNSHTSPLELKLGNQR